jgi:hypothetical protein
MPDNPAGRIAWRAWRPDGVTCREFLDKRTEKPQSKLSFAVIGRVPFFAVAEGFGGLVTSTAAPICQRGTGWSEPVAGWELHPLGNNT